ncbi:Methyltransferase small domain protein [uncultured Desulfobacterium sp.]|uniref:Methyltransferase small domain protein n=1 Tax=uncultured Desulfobacterium sp. TaxID=201089 RepID=A0A445MRF7_9BACT|nr:Methyltransferase small domain protein [uncultured Desulfobacterium sp.]
MKQSTSSEIQLLPDEELNLFLDGRLRLIQSKEGYRFSVDAVFLSEFVTIRPDDVVIDFGVGCGVIPLILSLTRPVRYALGIEIQEDLANQAARNVALNGLEGKIYIIQGDIKHPPFEGKIANVVVCNPPYRKVKSGRLNPDMRRAIARHELTISIDDILRTAGAVLRKKGRLAIIYPAERLADILARMRPHNLEPKRLQLNYPNLNSGAKLALIEACLAGKPGLKILPPLIGQGKFSLITGGRP